LWWVKILNSSPLVYVGTVSYMIYLIHIPVRVALFKLDRPGTTLVTHWQHRSFHKQSHPLLLWTAERFNNSHL
jgi:peptidoglycan/LPS O-acetylase OafA/YrhL